MNEEKIKRILLIRFSAIGDIILTFPVVEALSARFPGARIDYVTKAEFSELAASHPALAKVFGFHRETGFDGLRALAADLSRKGYDLVVDLHKNPRSLYLRFAVEAMMKRGYRKLVVSRHLLKWFHINLLKDAAPVCERYFTALEDLGIKREGRRPRLHLNGSLLSRVDKLIGEHGFDRGPLIALAPGASFPTKQWPGERFAQVAVRLARELDASAVILGSRGEKKTAEAVHEFLSAGRVPALDMSGRLSIMESAAVISRSLLLLTNDSGLMHIADALGKPLVAVFGPTTRELGFFPQGPAAKVVELPGLACRPCTLHGDRECPKGHHQCMTGIAPEMVAEAAREALAQARKNQEPAA